MSRPPISSFVTRRVFDGLDVVQERTNTNQVTAQLVRDGGVGGILSRTTATGAAFYGYDGNGNVTLLTNSAGQDVGSYRYDAFGNTLEIVGPRAGENPYRFSTKEFHAQSGLYDYGFRFYSPGMGRWLNRDPLGEDGGVNLYGMVGNNPINAVDEYGLYPSPWEWWKGKVNDFLEPPKATPSNSDEAGADDYAAAQNVAATTNHGRKTAAKAAAYGLEGYMAVLPGPKIRGVGSISRAASSSSRILSISGAGQKSQLYRKFLRHAGDFGIKGTANAKNLAAFSRALNRHLNSPSTKSIVGMYKHNPAILHVNPKTGLAVVTKYSGEFVSGWKLSSEQLIYTLRTGRLR